MTVNTSSVSATLYSPETRQVTCPHPAKLREIMDLTGLSKSSVYRLSADTDSTFPSPVKISERSSVWDRQKVVDYVNERFALAEEEASDVI